MLDTGIERWEAMDRAPELSDFAELFVLMLVWVVLVYAALRQTGFHTRMFGPRTAVVVLTLTPVVIVGAVYGIARLRHAYVRHKLRRTRERIRRERRAARRKASGTVD